MQCLLQDLGPLLSKDPNIHIWLWELYAIFMYKCLLPLRRLPFSAVSVGPGGPEYLCTHVEGSRLPKHMALVEMEQVGMPLK